MQTNKVASEPDEPMTTEKLLASINKAVGELGPPPTPVRLSPYATALPNAQPRTLDMQMMVDRIGRVRVPAAFRFRGFDGREVIVAHPDLFKAPTHD